MHFSIRTVYINIVSDGAAELIQDGTVCACDMSVFETS